MRGFKVISLKKYFELVLQAQRLFSTLRSVKGGLVSTAKKNQQVLGTKLRPEPGDGGIEPIVIQGIILFCCHGLQYHKEKLIYMTKSNLFNTL